MCERVVGDALAGLGAGLDWEKQFEALNLVRRMARHHHQALINSYGKKAPPLTAAVQQVGRGSGREGGGNGTERNGT